MVRKGCDVTVIICTARVFVQPHKVRRELPTSKWQPRMLLGSLPRFLVSHGRSGCRNADFASSRSCPPKMRQARPRSAGRIGEDTLLGTVINRVVCVTHEKLGADHSSGVPHGRRERAVRPAGAASETADWYVVTIHPSRGRMVWWTQ